MLYLLFTSQCGFGIKTRSVHWLDGDENFNDKCWEENPTTDRQCLDSFGKWVTDVDEAYECIGNTNSKRTYSDIITYFAEFLECW